MTTILNKVEAIVSAMDAHTADYFNSAEFDDMREFAERSISTKKAAIDARRKFFVITRDGSVVAFIDKESGDIFKPASWRTPAKGVRGNVNNADAGMGAFHFGSYGLTHVVYFK